MITKIEMTAAPDRNLKDADCQTPSQGTVCCHSPMSLPNRPYRLPIREIWVGGCPRPSAVGRMTLSAYPCIEDKWTLPEPLVPVLAYESREVRSRSTRRKTPIRRSEANAGHMSAFWETTPVKPSSTLARGKWYE
jgi:hypothetical protein